MQRILANASPLQVGVGWSTKGTKDTKEGELVGGGTGEASKRQCIIFMRALQLNLR